jgi:outer membrane autotransporter protein
MTFTNSITGSVTATGDNCCAICSASSIDFNGFAGTIQAGTTTSTRACGIQCDSSGSVAVTGDFGGTMTVVASNTAGDAYAITCDQGTFGVTGDFASDIHASGCNAYGIAAKSIKIDKAFTGSIDVEGNDYAVALISRPDAVSIADGISGAISAKATNGNAFAVLAYAGIYGSNADSAMEISGSVSASGVDAYAFATGGVINAEVTSTGTVSAQSTGSGAAYAFYAQNPSYNSTIKLDSGCTVVGDISLAGTADQLTLATSSDGKSHSTTLAGAIDGVEAINVTGGTWTVNGNIHDCNTFDISGGSASLNGICSGAVTVESAGTLCGTGTLASLTNYGTVAPGNSVGTLHVTGNYVGSSSSILKIETASDGTCDLIAVRGTATLNGDTVSVISTGGYKTGTQYTFLTAGTLAGADTVGIFTDSAFLAATLGYDATDMWFTLASKANYVDEAHTPNQYDVASYLDAHKTGAAGDFADVLDALNLQTGDGARAAFDAMSGEIYGSLATISIENNERFLRSISQRMQMHSMTQGFDVASNQADSSLLYVNRTTSSLDRLADRMSGWTTWCEGYGVGASLANNGNASGLGYSTGGLIVGVERPLDEYTLLGFAGGYANSHTTLQSRPDGAEIDGGQFTAYLHREFGDGYLTGVGGYGRNSFDVGRSIAFGSIDRSVDSKYDGNNYSTYVELGRNIRGRNLYWQPFGALEYIGVQQNGFTETGANSMDLDVQAMNANAFRSLLGTRFLAAFRTQSDHLLTWNASAMWRHEFLNDGRVLDASFVGQTDTAFAAYGVNVDRDAAILGTGLNYALSSHCSLYANYDLVFSRNYAANTGLGGFQYAW